MEESGFGNLSESNQRKQSEGSASWRIKCAEYSESGMSINAYCNEHGIPYYQMKYWLKKFAKQSGEERSDKFVEVQLSESSAEYVIRISNGRELILRGSYSVGRVERLLILKPG